MTNNKSIRVAIVDDHTLFRQGLTSLLSEYSEINIVFEAGNGAEMKQQISGRGVPDVILMDISMPVLDGYQATRWLKEHCPEVRILVLSTFEEDKPIINMLKNGAGGYLLKETGITEVVNAIRTIHQQGYYLNELISGKMLRNIQDQQQVEEIPTRLTANEKTFLQLCCSELTYKEIAHEMQLSPHTIDNYRQELFEKLAIKSRTGLVLFAIKSELFKP
jgi:DNA-binding NarL/FixJ family response regulator